MTSTIPHSRSRSRTSSHASEPPTSETDGDGSDGDALHRSTFAEEDDTIERELEDAFSQHPPLSWTARKSAVRIQHTPSSDNTATLTRRLPTPARPVGITNLNRRGNSQVARQPETGTGNEKMVELTADTSYSQVAENSGLKTAVASAILDPKLQQFEGGSGVGAALEKLDPAYLAPELESELSELETEDEQEGVKSSASGGGGVRVQGSGATKPVNSVPSVSGARFLQLQSCSTITHCQAFFCRHIQLQTAG